MGKLFSDPLKGLDGLVAFKCFMPEVPTLNRQCFGNGINI
ncbi:hypothetical protein SAMN05660745_01884 [Corynebacterium glucuronolyticum]|nr:hypothetical protein CGLUCO_10150 [Corynebacterium glucuronolyticum DSM 44120]SMB78267.1 hypothetical protein SAMN05660745_01884 [Corynebacterium glucuronolyticum]